MDVVLHTLDRLEAAPATGGLSGPLARLAAGIRRRGIVAVVSDLYEEPASVASAVRALVGRGCDVVVFHVLDPAELDFPFDEASTFRDLESGETAPVVPAEMRERYRAVVREHCRELERLLGRDGVEYALLTTSTPLDHALFAWLSRRSHLTRVR